MKKYFVLLITFIFFITILDVKAVDECSTSEMKRLKEIANNVQFKTNYEMDIYEDSEVSSVSLIYSIDIFNFSEDLKIFYNTEYADERIELKSNQNKITDLSEGDKITFYIYSYTNNLCTDEILKKVSVELPVYNRYYYYNKEKCDLHSEFKYCKEFMDTGDKQHFEIDLEFDKYLKEDIIDDIIDSNNLVWYIVIPVVSIAIIVIVFLIIKKIMIKREDI